MKKLRIKIIALIIPCLLLVLVNLKASAQVTGQDFKNKTPQQRAQIQTTMMKRRLQLDSGQLTKISAINLKYALKMDPVLKSGEGKFKRLREARAIQKAKDAELKNVLTTDQYAQYEKAEAEMREKLKSMGALN